jgi:hypothetical protein
VALGRSWIVALGPLLGAAAAMNLLSALCTAAAGGVAAWLVSRGTGARGATGWAATAGALCAGLGASVWSNATEAEVYSIALLHVMAMFVCAAHAGAGGRNAPRWMLCTTYVIALAPALHLLALVGAPAAIALAAQRPDGRWSGTTIALLGGALLAGAGIGRMSPLLVAAGVVLLVAPFIAPVVAGRARTSQRSSMALAHLAALALAASALLILLVRARHDPPLNQGDPSTLAALADAVARRQYAVAPLLPRQAPAWLQLANLAEYVDWQFALGWGRGIFTTPARVGVTVAFVALGVVGAREMRRDARRLADALLVLLLCGTLGVVAYLNMKAGASLGWGVLPDDAPHEARERDYFFVLGFWAWGLFAGYGAYALARMRRRPAWWALAAAAVPLVANWRESDRSRLPDRSAPRAFASALLGSAPAGAALFVSGDNDSYPLWYLQQVEGVRPDVYVVTLPLLPANWYAEEVARRTGWRWSPDEHVPGATWRQEQRAALIARAARGRGRTVAASPALTAGERAWLGGGWRLHGLVYVSGTPGPATKERATIDSGATLPWAARAPVRTRRPWPSVDDVAETMLAYLDCPRLALRPAGTAAGRDSLEVTCNLR